MSKVLLVDDSDVDRRLAGGMFRGRPEFELHFAKDGDDGLKMVQQVEPEIVLTDLQMPKMDGLEFVKAMRVEFPTIPVILMTAHGSEAVAVQALQAGAASYVPKSQLGSRLLETIDDLLAITRAERSYARLISYLRSTRFRFELENDPLAIDPLIDLVQQTAAGMRFCLGTEAYRMSVALKEALLNALYRGNLELPAAETIGDHLAKPNDAVRQRMTSPPYRSRRIFVDIEISDDESRFIIRDEGPGFDVAAKMPAASESIDVERGRGLLLMRSFMDSVEFNAKGNEVRMIKRRS